jgi:hypothetical protein
MNARLFLILYLIIDVGFTAALGIANVLGGHGYHFLVLNGARVAITGGIIGAWMAGYTKGLEALLLGRRPRSDA